jgi:hypothetical protein
MEAYEYKLPCKNDLETEIDEKLKALEETLCKAPGNKETMENTDFWAILCVSLHDLANSAGDLCNAGNPYKKENAPKLVLPDHLN